MSASSYLTIITVSSVLLADGATVCLRFTFYSSEEIPVFLTPHGSPFNWLERLVILEPGSKEGGGGVAHHVSVINQLMHKRPGQSRWWWYWQETRVGWGVSSLPTKTSVGGGGREANVRNWVITLGTSIDHFGEFIINSSVRQLLRFRGVPREDWTWIACH